MAGTITHEWQGTTLVVTSDSGTSACDLKGAQGDVGVRGCQGAPGIVNIDSTLSTPGYGADAAAVGAKIASLEENTANLETEITSLEESTANLETKVTNLETEVTKNANTTNNAIEATATLNEEVGVLNARTTDLESRVGEGVKTYYEHSYTFVYPRTEDNTTRTLRLIFLDSSNEPKDSFKKLYLYLTEKDCTSETRIKPAHGCIVTASDSGRLLDTIWGIYTWGSVLNIRGTRDGINTSLGIDASTTIATDVDYWIQEV